ncbi:hypothetical protein [Pantoea phage Nafs113]|nr:hypothetical protein [Pantoea phage Nafs113]
MKNEHPMKTLQSYVTMAENFKSFQVDPRSCSELAAAIKWLIADRHNHLNRVALLRQRPDLPVDRIHAYREMERLQRLEQELLTPREGGEFYGLTAKQVSEWAWENGGLMSRAEFASLCQLALERMEEFIDPRGVTWTPPTAYAYAQVCSALHQAREKLTLAGIE